MVTLIPSFILSELKVAFLMGFRLYLPFLIIDMVISSVLISMGMLMLPPVLISLPFKLLLFVLADGWRLVVGASSHARLYRLDDDPREQANVAKRHPEKLAELQALLQVEIAAQQAARERLGAGAMAPISPGRSERLEALGYGGGDGD